MKSKTHNKNKMKIQKPHFTITRINDNRAIWHLAALIVAASIILLFVTALNFAGAVTNPPQGNVVPNFSGLKVKGLAELEGAISNPNGNVTISDKLDIGDSLHLDNATGNIDMHGGVIKNSTSKNGGNVQIDDKLVTTSLETGGALFNGGVTMKDVLQAFKGLSVGGQLTDYNLQVAGKARFNGDVDAQGIIKNTGTANYGAVKIDDELSVTGSLKNDDVTTSGGSPVDLPLYIMDDVKINGTIKSMSGILKIADNLDVFGEIKNSSYNALEPNRPVEIGENLRVYGNVDVKGGGKLMRDGTNYFDYVEVTTSKNVTDGSVANISAVCNTANGYYPLSCSSEPQGTRVYKMWNNKSAGSCELLVLNQNGFATTVKVKAACAKP
ncbi:hypothetical protein HZA39_03930 [Candidatus Peregrinibacteria bacterium]|nr:hypothetical protein [Candidatus Peregrinibacteria bacterium]